MCASIGFPSLLTPSGTHTAPNALNICPFVPDTLLKGYVATAAPDVFIFTT